jgi:hypothetical protein
MRALVMFLAAAVVLLPLTASDYTETRGMILAK